MRLRHNKKRNTAFLYEVLIREIAKNVLTENDNEKYKIISLLRDHFLGETEISRELELYKSLYETKDMEPYVAEKLIQEAKKSYAELDQDKIFMEQSIVISKINKVLSKNVFSNFVPNYKNLATIAQIFSGGQAVKSRVLLESALLKRMTNSAEVQQTKVPVSNLVYKTFIKKFNEEYNNKLLEEQKTLLNNYILSFTDNGVSLKLFLNEEISRLKKVLNEALEMDGVRGDLNLVKKTNEVLRVIENFKNKPIGPDLFKQILKIQILAEEIKN